MMIQKSLLTMMLSALFILIGCDSDINFDRALKIYGPDANLLSNIASEVEFDSVLISKTTSEIFTIENTGSSELNLTGDPIVEITGDNNLVFSVIAMPKTTIKPGEWTTFEIEFAPISIAFYDATVTILSNDPDLSPFTFSIIGRGVEPGINVKQSEIYVPNNTGIFDFGNFDVLKATSEVTFTIENSGTCDLNLTGMPMIEISGEDTTSFSLNDSTLSTPIAPDSATTFTLSFTPDSEGLKTATITIANDDSNKNPYTFTVHGTGTIPEINIKQGTTDIPSGSGKYLFGKVKVNTGSEITFTIENTGPSDLLLTGTPKIQVSGTNASMFSVNDTMTVTPVSAFSSTTFTITFTPASEGNFNATVTIASNDADENPYKLTVEGTGSFPDMDVMIGVTVIPSSTGNCDFGNVKVNTSKEIELTIKNTGVVELELTGTPKIQVSGTDSSMFSVNESMTQKDIPDASTTTFKITFTPTSEGLKTATISIANDDPDNNPYTFDITGTGAVPKIRILQGASVISSGSYYNFGEVKINTNKEVIFTIDNTGNADLELTGSPKISVTNGSVSMFIVNETMTRTTIPANSSTTFTIKFAPTSEIMATVTISIANNDSDKNPYTFSANGSGTVPRIAVEQNKKYISSGTGTYDFGTVCKDRESKPVTFVIRNYGFAEMRLTGSPLIKISGPDSSDFVIDQTLTPYRIYPNTNATFTITFKPISLGKKEATITIECDDPYKNPYTFTITGKTTTFDFNGDGYDDVLVGAEYNNGGGSNSGSAYIFFGGTSALAQIDAANANVILIGEDIDDHFGSSVSNAGDVNGDGYDDVIIGASGDDDGGTNSGSAFIFFGSSNPQSSIDAADANVKIICDDYFDYFGHSVSDAGDVNGDGYDDVIIGCSDSYYAYIYFGGSNIPSQMDTSNPDLLLYGNSIHDRFGYSVSSAGDVDNDGYDDVIVGAIYDDDGGSNSGCAFIFFGNYSFYSSISASRADVKIVGEDSGDYLGCSVSNAGDVNGDGYDDVIVGAYLNSTNNSASGAAYIIFGNTNMSSSIDASNADVRLYANNTNVYFGNSVSSAGDVNGDGFDDIIVGASNDDFIANGSGCAYIIFGNSTFISRIDEPSFDVKLCGSSSNDRFGISVSNTGDFNCDGHSDIVVGAFLDDDGGPDSGCGFIFNGQSHMARIINASNANVILIGEDSSDHFGNSVDGGN